MRREPLAAECKIRVGEKIALHKGVDFSGVGDSQGDYRQR
jgi:hypothetical protein